MCVIVNAIQLGQRIRTQNYRKVSLTFRDFVNYVTEGH